jgi:hypothetical protein
LKKMRNQILYILKHTVSLILWASFFLCLFLSIGCSSGIHGAISDEQLLDKLISDYFSSWSKPDMQAYQKCFHPKASIYFIDGPGDPHHFRLENFIAIQKKAHISTTKPMSEKPTQTSIEVRGRIANALVRWELHKGNASTTGTDIFTFVKTDQGWKILTLVFEADQK